MSKILLFLSQNLFAYVVITVVFLVLGLLIVLIVWLHKKRVSNMILQQALQKQTFEKQLLQTQIEVQESTYSVLSNELHDNVCQLLSTSKLMLGIMKMESDNPPEKLTTAIQTIGTAINEIRTLSKSLSKEWLEKFDLAENLATETKRINATEKVMVHYPQISKLNIVANRQIIIFRIVQEAIQNAIKHGAPANIFISIALSHNTMTATVRDDGKGFDPADKTEGMGTLNMKQRVNLLEGDINWKSAGKGCTVTFTIPLLAEEMD